MWSAGAHYGLLAQMSSVVRSHSRRGKWRGTPERAILAWLEWPSKSDQMLGTEFPLVVFVRCVTLPC